MDSAFDFEVGELVEHVRYGYRGVVAARDQSCRAAEAWYAKNQTQPPRDQPWYHVLVHGGSHSTYAAQTSLRKDEGREQVVHPLSRRLFQHFASGRYTQRDDVRFEDFFEQDED